MKELYLIRELTVLRSNMYKSLNIYEEENDIEAHNKRERKNLNVRRPLTFAEYIDKMARTIEGIVLGLDYKNNKNHAIIGIDLQNIKCKILELKFRHGVDTYFSLRKNLFNCINNISDLLNILEIKE